MECRGRIMCVHIIEIFKITNNVIKLWNTERLYSLSQILELLVKEWYQIVKLAMKRRS